MQVGVLIPPIPRFAGGGVVGGSAPANSNSPVQVIIENHGADVSTKSETGANGQQILRVIVDATAKDMTTPGSSTARAMRVGYGLNPQLTRRGS